MSTPPGPGDAVDAFVERFAGDMAEAGMPRMPARVFAALLASEDGVLGSAELSARLRISPAAVSGAVRYLSQVGMIAREREPGTRRERYRVRNDQLYQAIANRDRILSRWEATLRTGVDAVGPTTGAGERLIETVEFFTFMQQELAGMLERWQARQRQPGD